MSIDTVNLAFALGGSLAILWVWVQWGAAFYVQCTGCYRTTRIRAALVQHYQPHAITHAVNYLGWRVLPLNTSLSVTSGDKTTVFWTRKRDLPFCPDCIKEQWLAESGVRHQYSLQPVAPAVPPAKEPTDA